MYSRSPNEVISLTLTHIPSTVLLLFNFWIMASLIPQMAVQFLYLLPNFPPEIAPRYIYSYQSRKVSLSPVFIIQFISVRFSCSVVSDSLWPHESQHYHQFLEFTQTHVYRVGDTIQTSHPLPSCSSLLARFSNFLRIRRWL